MYTRTHAKETGDYKTQRPAKQQEFRHILQTPPLNAGADNGTESAFASLADQHTELHPAGRAVCTPGSAAHVPLMGAAPLRPPRQEPCLARRELLAARELPVCLKVLEQHYIDYCLIFAGLQNVQGDTGKFRDF